MRRSIGLPTRSFVVAVLLAHGRIAAGEAPASTLAEVDRLWETRAEGATGKGAVAGPVEAVIAACRKGLAETPASVEIRWRLMRACYYKGQYVARDVAKKREAFDEGKAAGEEALPLIRKAAAARSGKPLENASPVELVPHLQGDGAATAAFYWASVDWGKWALVFGKTAAVKKGAATKIRDYATAVILLDPRFEAGGGYRVLGRLHHQTPFVPFLTGWASRGEALKNLRLAVKTAPDEFISRLYLAEATWDYEPSRRDEARKMLEKLIAAVPSPAFPVEDPATQEEARVLLAAWDKR